jgi:hypothetical protein
MGRGGSGARTALIVPGAAVRRYVSGAVDALHAVGISAELLVAPGEPRVPADLVEYGRALAGRIVSSGGVDALIGLSVGAQAAAVAAAVATESPPHSPPTGPPNEPLSVTSPRYRHVDVLLFQHGVASEGIATPDDWARIVRSHGATVGFPGLDRRRFPHDIAALARYGPAMARLPAAREPWTPLHPLQALEGLADAGLTSTHISPDTSTLFEGEK